LCDRNYFTAKLGDFLPQLDWRNDGALKGLGGEAGVKEAIGILRQIRAAHGLKVLDRAQ
jgi:hypothetical protein